MTQCPSKRQRLNPKDVKTPLLLQLSGPAPESSVTLGCPECADFRDPSCLPCFGAPESSLRHTLEIPGCAGPHKGRSCSECCMELVMEHSHSVLYPSNSGALPDISPRGSLRLEAADRDRSRGEGYLQCARYGNGCRGAPRSIILWVVLQQVDLICEGLRGKSICSECALEVLSKYCHDIFKQPEATDLD